MLWDELLLYKQTVGENPLDISDHSSGSSHCSLDMKEFKEAVNNMEVDDIRSTGCQFTWTKSLKNPMYTILKKLDRILINEEFINKFQNAHGMFLPYTISDHSPSIIVIKDGLPKKKKSFRFSNFISDKEEFLDMVKKEWNQDIDGCHIYRLVKKLRNLKKPLNRLSWRNGNVFENVKKLREDSKSMQMIVDQNPHNESAKKDVVIALNKYTQAANDELSLLK